MIMMIMMIANSKIKIKAQKKLILQVIHIKKMMIINRRKIKLKMNKKIKI